MNRDDIIRMALEAGGCTPEWDDFWELHEDALERFAALVAAAERERIDLNAIHTCHAECQNPFCVRVREAVAHEREGCAKVCEGIRYSGYCPPEDGAAPDYYNSAAAECADAIRARGGL